MFLFIFYICSLSYTTLQFNQFLLPSILTSCISIICVCLCSSTDRGYVFALNAFLALGITTCFPPSLDCIPAPVHSLPRRAVPVTPPWARKMSACARRSRSHERPRLLLLLVVRLRHSSSARQHLVLEQAERVAQRPVATVFSGIPGR